MADPYQPALGAFALAAEEAAVVTAALAAAKPWDFEPPTAAEVAALKRAKDRILAYHLERHGWTCCYCRTNLRGAGPFMTDREHILPKGKPVYKPFSYALWNLAAACKRCNMQFKKSGDAFVVDKLDPARFESSDNYLFVHPNFDRWEDHLTRLGVQVNGRTLVIIRRKGTPKADFTHGFFNLHAFEVDSFDRAQGREIPPEESEAAALLRALADEFGQ